MQLRFYNGNAVYSKFPFRIPLSIYGGNVLFFVVCVTTFRAYQSLIIQNYNITQLPE